MLPKLQQSSLAQSLRRDNPATLIQSNSSLMQRRINSRTLLARRTINHTNLGKINMHPRIPILPLETSLKIILQRGSYRKKDMNPINRWHYQVHYKSKKDFKEQEESAHQPCKKRRPSSLHHPRVEHFKKEMCQLPNFGDIMTEETYLFE